jgi:hypothetical protein
MIISTDNLNKDLKTGSGTELDRKEVRKIGSQGKFQCLNDHLGLATSQAASAHFLGIGKSYGYATTIDILSDDILVEILLEILGFVLRPRFSECHIFYPRLPHMEVVKFRVQVVRDKLVGERVTAPCRRRIMPLPAIYTFVSVPRTSMLFAK